MVTPSYMINVSKINRAYIFSFPDTNRFDNSVSEELEERINRLVKKNKCMIVLNLKGILFIDSRGFELLVRMAKITEENNYSFGICNVSDEVKELISIMDFNEVLEVFRERLVVSY
jgi:anti-anti-sigma factor